MLRRVRARRSPTAGRRRGQRQVVSKRFEFVAVLRRRPLRAGRPGAVPRPAAGASTRVGGHRPASASGSARVRRSRSGPGRVVVETSAVPPTSPRCERTSSPGLEKVREEVRRRLTARDRVLGRPRQSSSRSWPTPAATPASEPDRSRAGPRTSPPGGRRASAELEREEQLLSQAPSRRIARWWRRRSDLPSRPPGPTARTTARSIPRLEHRAERGGARRRRSALERDGPCSCLATTPAYDMRSIGRGRRCPSLEVKGRVAGRRHFHGDPQRDPARALNVPTPCARTGRGRPEGARRSTRCPLRGSARSAGLMLCRSDDERQRLLSGLTCGPWDGAMSDEADRSGPPDRSDQRGVRRRTRTEDGTITNVHKWFAPMPLAGVAGPTVRRDR